MADRNGTPTPIEELVDRLDGGWADFEGALERIDDEAAETVIRPGWTVKAMVAHIAFWHDLSVVRLRALRNAGSLPPLEADVDTLNARATARAEGRDWASIRGDLFGSARRFRAALLELPAEVLDVNRGHIAELVEDNSFGHYPEHIAELEALELGS